MSLVRRVFFFSCLTLDCDSPISKHQHKTVLFCLKCVIVFLPRFVDKYKFSSEELGDISFIAWGTSKGRIKRGRELMRVDESWQLRIFTIGILSLTSKKIKDWWGFWLCFHFNKTHDCVEKALNYSQTRSGACQLSSTLINSRPRLIRP